MKLEFLDNWAGGHRLELASSRWRADSETAPLREVLLFPPAFLEPVPCCSVTREQLRDGFQIRRDAALAQHAGLAAALRDHGVTCHVAPAASGAPDLCFARDVAVTTPWGLVALNPALPHRRAEVDHLLAATRAMGISPVMRIEAGTIEGGDICIARPGLLILGCSGERTNAAGAQAFAAPFRRAGWDVLTHHYDPHFLHLDTIFCMLDEHRALACVDVLADDFVAQLHERDIELIPATYKEARSLGCNILSLGGRTILMSAGHDRIARELDRAGFAPLAVELSQLTACGGGVHCLTMPLARAATSSDHGEPLAGTP